MQTLKGRWYLNTHRWDFLSQSALWWRQQRSLEWYAFQIQDQDLVSGMEWHFLKYIFIFSICSLNSANTKNTPCLIQTKHWSTLWKAAMLLMLTEGSAMFCFDWASCANWTTVKYLQLRPPDIFTQRVYSMLTFIPLPDCCCFGSLPVCSCCRPDGCMGCTPQTR